LYCRVTPGLTGLWQVSGRNTVSARDRVRLDSYYVRNWSPWLDLHILARTAKVVLTGQGAY
jgi:lipopolysaccharide/colanic/teichoic acid biosynthesis glycosyltransferase